MKNIISKQQLDDIHEFCVDYDISEYTLNPDGSIDVQQNVEIDDLPHNMEMLPFKFNTVQGDFKVTDTHLTSLVNFPKVVMGDVDVSDNELTSLEGCPEFINGDFDFTNNEISSFIVGNYQVSVNGKIACGYNKYSNTLLFAISEVTEDYLDDDPYFYPNGEDIMFDENIVKLFFKYQNHFEIWNGNELNEKNFMEFMDEVKDGLL